MKKPKNWQKWIDIEFKGMSFNEIFPEMKRGKKKKGVHADEDFDIGV